MMIKEKGRLHIHQEEMKHVSFPDCRIEEMEYLPVEKSVKISIDGAWRKTGIDQGYDLGRGEVFFSDWETIVITRYYDSENRFEIVNEYPVEELECMYETTFTDTDAEIGGFGRDSGQWLIWKMTSVKMHAEFEDYVPGA